MFSSAIANVGVIAAVMAMAESQNAMRCIVELISHHPRNVADMEEWFYSIFFLMLCAVSSIV